MATCNGDESHSILTAIRIHRQQQQRSNFIDLTSLKECIFSSLKFSSQILIGVDAADAGLVSAIRKDQSIQLKEFDLQVQYDKGSVILLPISPYFKFTIALNSLLDIALHLNIPFICYSSVEMRVVPSEVDAIMQQMTPTTLVVGKAFYSHRFQKGKNILGGYTSPWNTFAIWRVQDLATTGFLMISDLNTQPGQSAIEEVPTISLLQRLNPSRRAVLLWTHALDAESDGWQSVWKDQTRNAWQASKLKSKETSAVSHLQRLGIQNGTVEHLYANGIEPTDIS